jgi:cytochrome b
MMRETSDTCLKSHRVWDLPTRWFHWINALCVFVLAGLGLVILNAGALEVSNDGKVLLKTFHVWAGYLFVVNLSVRIVWGFLGNHFARWRQMLPGGRGYLTALRSYLTSFASDRPEQYLGHNPLGRIAIAGLLLVMLTQASSGLFLAGSDLYFPPFGTWISNWIAAPEVDPASLVPYSPAMYDDAAYAEMRSFRKPIALIHLYGFYLLVFGIAVHITGVVVTELREGGGLISAMVSGRKVLAEHPVDAPGSGPGGTGDGDV